MVPETADQVIVDHPGGLEQRIADGAAHKGKTFGL
jgi:hypothetical protein